MPSQEIQDRMRCELAGVFIDRAMDEPYRWLVAKLPMNLIREIQVGAALSLKVWVVEIDDKRILSFGLTTYDDPAAPRTFFGSCRSDAEAADLRVLLAAGAFPVQFHNEVYLPLLYAECRIDPRAAGEVLSLAPTPNVPATQAAGLRERANDAVAAWLTNGTDPRIKASCDLSITVGHTQPIRVMVAGIGEVNLTDADQGGELERLTFQAFESMFPFGAFVSPRVGEGAKRRELCDVLAVSRVRESENEGVFVVQNKVASAFPEGLRRKTARRAKSIENNIVDAIGQLGGAIKALKSGRTIFRNEDGTSIEVDPPLPELAGRVEPLNLRERANQIGHGLVVVSDMHEGVDWDRVFLALAEVWVATRYYCQVLDLQELGRLVAHSRGRPALLEGLLLERGKVMVERETAFIRFQFTA